MQSAPLTKLTRYILTNLSKTLSTSSSYLLSSPSSSSNNANYYESTNYDREDEPDNLITLSTVDSVGGSPRRATISSSSLSPSPSVVSFASLSPQPLVGLPSVSSDEESNLIRDRKSGIRSLFDSDEGVKLDWLISDWSSCSQSCSEHGIQVN